MAEGLLLSPDNQAPLVERLGEGDLNQKGESNE
jgi:hypothetical protein